MRDFEIGFLINALVFAVAGLLLLWAAVAVVRKSPLWTDATGGSTASAIIVAAIVIAAGLIIAGTMH
jgi:hypothetical protein